MLDQRKINELIGASIFWGGIVFILLFFLMIGGALFFC